MRRLSIIIPYQGNPRRLEKTLVSVLENRPENSEIVVVLNAPYNDPYDLEDEVRYIAGRRRRPIDGVNLAARTSTAPLIHVLHCGTEVEEGWADAACQRFADSEVAAVVPVLLDAGTRTALVAAGVKYRCGGRISPLLKSSVSSGGVLAPHLAGGFYRRAAIEAAGWFDSRLPADLSAVDMALKMTVLGLETVNEPECRLFATRAEFERQGFSHGMAAERLYWRWAPRGGWFRSLAYHALLLGGECCASLVRPARLSHLAGRIMGGVHIGCHRRTGSLDDPLPELAATPVAAPHFRRDAVTAAPRRRLAG